MRDFFSQTLQLRRGYTTHPSSTSQTMGIIDMLLPSQLENQSSRTLNINLRTAGNDPRQIRHQKDLKLVGTPFKHTTAPEVLFFNSRTNQLDVREHKTVSDIRFE